MRLDFDKLNLSQKIYTIIGALTAIFVYMDDADSLNIAISIVFLTAIWVFLLKYNIFKKIVNCVLLLSFIGSVLYVTNAQINNGNLQLGVSKGKELKTYRIELKDGRKVKITGEGGPPTPQEMVDIISQLNTTTQQVSDDSFSIGAPQPVVKRIQGNPTSIIGGMWFYGSDSVTFDSGGKVSGYRNNSGKLKIK